MNRLELVKVVYEDPWLLVVDKPAGVAVHADPNPRRKFLFADLQSHLQESRGETLTLFHRLDRETSGLVIFGRRSEIRAEMNDLFEKKVIRKSYTAVVQGRWLPQWNRVDNFLHKDEIGRWQNRTTPPGRPARTTFRLLAASDSKSWLEVIPKTGRTHQIRLHCLERGAPILGDLLYNPMCVADSPSQALHAYGIDFKHPRTAETLRLRTEPPLVWKTHWLKDLPAIEKTYARLFRSEP